MFVSSVCDAHKINGKWHRNNKGPDSHRHPPTPAEHCEENPGNPHVKWACDMAGNPGNSIVSDVPDDTEPTADDTEPTANNFIPTSFSTQQDQPVYTPIPIIVTEYMLRDWSKKTGGGLPQWIELYNPNAEPMRLDGYQFTHAYRKFANAPWVYVTLSITGLTIPASNAALIANRSVRSGKISRISKKDVWVIPYDEDPARLKNGWYLTDPKGQLVHRIGTVFQKYPADVPSNWNPSLRGPELPSHNSDGYKVSYQSYPSGNPAGDHFYGNENDVGSPGFYEAAPAAPSLQRPKLTTTWGHLKQAK